MTRSFDNLEQELYERDPGAVARVDQLHAKMRDDYDRWYWRLVRWWDRRRSG
jgi:hypothetical protein